jgi:hypothetical protein
MLYCAYVSSQLFVFVIYRPMIINRYLLCVIRLLFNQYCAISDPEIPTHRQRYTDTDRDTRTQTETHRHKQRHTDTDRDTHGQRQRHTRTQTETQPEIDRDTHGHGHGQRHTRTDRGTHGLREEIGYGPEQSLRPSGRPSSARASGLDPIIQHCQVRGQFGCLK